MNQEDVKLLGDFFREWGQQGYPFIDENGHTKEREALRSLLILRKDGDEDAAKALNDLSNQLEKPKLSGFDYSQHISSLLQQYGGMNEKQMDIYQKNVFERKNESSCSIPFHRFLSSRFLDKLVQGEEEEAFQKKANKILNRLLSSKGQPNEKLAEVLKDAPVIFCFEDIKPVDGGIESVLIDGKRRAVVTLTRGCIEQESDCLVAETIAHELGHYLDGHERKNESLDGNMLLSETFADSVAYRALINAQYNPSAVLPFKREFADMVVQRKGEDHPFAQVQLIRADILENVVKNENKNAFVFQKVGSRE